MTEAVFFDKKQFVHDGSLRTHGPEKPAHGDRGDFAIKHLDGWAIRAGDEPQYRGCYGCGRWIPVALIQRTGVLVAITNGDTPDAGMVRMRFVCKCGNTDEFDVAPLPSPLVRLEPLDVLAEIDTWASVDGRPIRLHPGEMFSGVLGRKIFNSKAKRVRPIEGEWFFCRNARCQVAIAADEIRAQGTPVDGPVLVTTRRSILTTPQGAQHVVEAGEHLNPTAWPPALVQRLLDVNGPDAIEQAEGVTMFRFVCSNCRRDSIYPLIVEETAKEEV